MPGPIAASHLGAVVRDAVPPWAVPAFHAVTYLGNVGVLLVVFALDYWFGDARRGAHALGLAVAGMALITALKSFFAVPRPPPSVAVVPISGYSFPSGHATASTIVYGILAHDLRVGSRRLRYGAAGLLVGLIALSRIVLGVHYLRDVVAGVVVGVGFLAAAIALTRHVPWRGFLLALGIAVVAAVVSGASQDGVAVLGAAAGGAAAWSLLDADPTVDSRWESLVLLVGVLPVLAVAGYLGTVPDLGAAAVFALNAGVLAGIVASPAVVARFTASRAPSPG